MILLRIPLFFFLSLGLIFASNEQTKWEEYDMIPMPKEISKTSQVWKLTPETTVVVIGKKPSPQSRFGADWINRRIEAAGGHALPILEEGAPISADVKRIIVGTREDNPLITSSLQQANGYQLQLSDEGNTLYLAGADPVGALYACVTLGELIKPGAVPTFPVVNIRDWPDIQPIYVLGMVPPSDVVKNPDSPKAREAYLKKLTDMYDEMLRRKLSMVWYKPGAWGFKAFREMSPYARETLRMGIEEGKLRGISSLYYHLQPFVGLRADHPHTSPDLLEQNPKARYKEWLQSWSMDEERRAYAKELATWVKDVGFTDVGFHDTDTGGYLNPANWNHRGLADQKRWGDDYTGATINKFRIFYEEMKKANPDLRLNFTLYPYHTAIFSPSETAQKNIQSTLHIDADELEKLRLRYADFWKRLNAAFPKSDVSFAIREPGSDHAVPGLDKFLSYIEGRPLFFWYGLGASEFYTNAPAWLGTLYRNMPGNMVFTQNIYVDHGFVPMLSFAMREYSWNTQAPGAAPYQSRDLVRTYASAAGDSSTPAYSVMLPHLVRNYFGRDLAPYITKALQQNVSPYIIFGGRPERNIVDETEERMKLEAERSAVASEAMQSAWTQLGGLKNQLHLEDAVFLRVAYLLQVFYSTHAVASLKEAIYRSQSLSSVGRFEDALAVLNTAREQLQSAENLLSTLEKEGPAAIRSRLYTAAYTRTQTLPRLRELLQKRIDITEQQKKLGGVPASILNALADIKTLPVTQGDVSPEIDGKVQEAVWKKAWPVQIPFLSGRGKLVADVETTVMTLADSEHLFVGFKCHTAGPEDSSREFVRIYLQTPDGSQMAAFAVWANGKLEIYDKSKASLVTYATSVDTSGWQGEMRIPLREFGIDTTKSGYRIGFVRGYNQSGIDATASLVPMDASIAGAFEAARPLLSKFPEISWETQPFQPSAKIRIYPSHIREVTLDDRIATVADFQITVDADCLLENVTIEAEAINEENKVEATKKLLSIPRIKYHLKPSETFTIAFQQALTKGSIRVVLKSDQIERSTMEAFDLTPQKP